MDREANLPAPPPPSQSDKSSPSSPPHFLRQVQAAFKRHRPLGTMQSNNILPRRSVCLPRREPLSSVASNLARSVDTMKSHDALQQKHCQTEKDSDDNSKNIISAVGESQEDASITPRSLSETSTKSSDENFIAYNSQRDQPKSAIGCKDMHVESHQAEIPKKVNFSVENNTSQGADDQMSIGIENLSSHMGSLALTEMELDENNQAETSAVINHDARQHNYQQIDSEVSLRSDGAVSSLLAKRSKVVQENHDARQHNYQQIDSEVSLRSDGAVSSLLAKRSMVVQEKPHQCTNFLSQPINQSSVAGSSCPTTTSVHLTSAPMLSSTTYSSHPHQGGASRAPVVGSLGNVNKNSPPLTQKDMIQNSHFSAKDSCRLLANQTTNEAQGSTPIYNQIDVKKSDISRGKQDDPEKACDIPRDQSSYQSKLSGAHSVDVMDVQSQAPLSKSSFSDMKSEQLKTEKSEKQEKTASSKGAAASRKRSYDPDSFFKVNGKLYQRLGKIGSGGSSEVHKVISSDCTIYALKKIKLKGRDYATAYGFCQEIEYLNRLKGKNHIIQLIDYEVTDKALLNEVLSGSMSNKDSKVWDDGYIYMVLEYGEIDLAHMLSQKWKEIGESHQTIDENWLRFYWQQILLAVNTIHEERIVHSDLKPANFLLVRGSLKLIDFGIAKAIMSDTTNIQRDSQVGTLSYMSPEAFMCNENDTDGNVIKCGRPSDIWSLGCILYQMVYGRTPFSEYKTFWAKFKVITDPNHEISYKPVSNPWLLDLMKKCLAWDRNERWRIPQLLQHPFLNPPLPQPPSFEGQNCRLFQLIAETCCGDQEASMLCFQLKQLLTNPVFSTFRNQQCKLLCQVSKLCFQLQERLANSEKIAEDPTV